MNVRVAVNGVALAPGGGLTFLVNQAARLREFGDLTFDYFIAPRCVDILAKVVGRDRVFVPFERPPSLCQRIWWEQITLPRALRKLGYDLLYVPSAFAVVRSPIPQLVVNHNPNHHAGIRELGMSRLYVRARVERLVAQTTGRHANAVVYLSHAFARAASEVALPPVTRVIHSGVSDDWPQPSPLRDVLSCIECTEHGYALAVHHWYAHKHLPWLIRTWAENQRQAMHLVLVGGPVFRGEERSVRRMLEASAKSGRIHVVEHADRAQVAALYSHARVYISASVLEALPLTPLEAQSFRLPLVLSDIPPHREVGGSYACYYRLDDADEFWQCVRQATSRGARMYQSNLVAFQWSTHAQQFREVLLSLRN